MIFIPWHFPNHFNRNIKGINQNDEIEFKNNYKSLYKHLQSHKKRLENRNQAETNINYSWYCLQRWASDYYQDFEKEKIIYPETTQGVYMYYDEDKFYIDKTNFILTGNQLKYIYALMNSKVFTYYYIKFAPSTKLGSKGWQYNKHAMETVPIPIPTKEIEEELTNLINKLLELKNNNQDTHVQEKKINKIVYKLYKLTKSQIKLIEEF